MDAQQQPLETYDFSCLVALLAGSQPNSCFKDAWEALINLPQWFRYGYYVEGWIVIELTREVLVIEHAWCLLADGRVVDPAIIFLIERQQPVWYLPGVIYSWEETLAFEGELLPRVREGSDGMQHPAYKVAYEAAWETATNIARATDPPKQLAIHTAQPEPEGPPEPQRQKDVLWIIHTIPSSSPEPERR